MKVKHVLIAIGLMPLLVVGGFAQSQSDVRQKAEQLRMLANQANDLARVADQNAANEDQQAQSGPTWARTVHQVAAVGFRDQANKNRENARQLLAQAQELERESIAEPSRNAPAQPSSVPTSGREDYLSLEHESIVEGVIEAYLNRNGMKASTVNGNGGAIHYVLVGFTSANGLPTLEYKISALPPYSSGSDPQIQLIGITLETEIKVANQTETLHSALMEANKIGNCAWFVDSGEIKCRSWITIPGAAYPVPAELVRSKIRIINSDWLRFSPNIVAASK